MRDDAFGKESIKLSGIGQTLLHKKEDEDVRRKLKKKEPDTALDISIGELMISFVAKV